MFSPLLTHANIHGLVRNVLRLAVPVATLLTIYLYLYPFFLTCGFPLPSTAPSPHNGPVGAWLETIKLHLPATDYERPTPAFSVAPFRLLAFGDPQIEGDTSIPNYYKSSSFPHLRSFFERLVSPSDQHPTFRSSTKQAFHDLVDFYFDDIPDTLESIRKRIDLFGNDFYLAHMFRALHWWTVPTHVTVLGDLVGSQWISDDEFTRRGDRFWQRAFRGGERVPDDLAIWPAETYDTAGDLGTAIHNATWARRLLNVAGNHDVGYAGDLTTERMARFERVFGKANYELRFELPAAVLSPAGAATILNDSAPDEATHPDHLTPELRIVVLNDMNLDTPVVNTELQDQTYKFINDVINNAAAVEYKGQFTVVLTHVPLYKVEGVCVDAPFFSFHDDDGTLKEQNQLSADASKGFVEGIFGLSGDSGAVGGGRGRRGVVLNGHDHEGCDTYHFINQSTPLMGPDEADLFDFEDPKREWEATTWRKAVQEGLVGVPSLPGVREITVRSMMGDYGGNAGLLSAWFDEDTWEWRFEYATCAFGTQHLWWAVHITDLIIAVLLLVYVVSSVVLASAMGPVKETKSVKMNGKESVKENGIAKMNGKENGQANGETHQDL